MIEWYWCLLLILIAVFITVVLMAVFSLFGRRQDFEIDESEEFSGVINVREYNKTHNNSSDDDRLRSKHGRKGG